MSLQTDSEARQGQQEKAQQESDQRLRRKEAREQERIERKAEELIEQVFGKSKGLALTQTDIETRLMVSGEMAKSVVGFCLRNEWLVDAPKAVLKNGRKYDGYKLPDELVLTPTDSD